MNDLVYDYYYYRDNREDEPKITNFRTSVHRPESLPAGSDCIF